MDDIAISFRNVGKTFAGCGAVVAVDDLTFDVRCGEYVCIVGRTGCGKSTTFGLLLGLQRPSRGSVRTFGSDPFARFDDLRGKIGCVFQSDRLLPWRSAIDNVRVPIEIIGVDERRLQQSPAQWLDRLGLRGFENAYPHELSGGMRQRVAIARALASDPSALLADEAFGHLDEVTGGKLREDFRRLAKEGGKTVLHVTHSIDEAIALGDRILVFGQPGHVAAEFAGQRVTGAAVRDQLRERIFRAIGDSDRRGAGDRAAGRAAA